MKLLDLIKLPEEKFVIEQNKSPKPDLLNDCEVRREGFNSCLSEIRKLNEGAEIKIDKNKIEDIFRSYGFSYLKNLIEEVSKSLDKWLVVKRKEF